MSNLYKQSFVVNTNMQKRIINSNAIIKDKIQENENLGGLRFSSFEEETVSENQEEEFAEGIVAEMVECQPEEALPEELLAEANQQAEEILLEARRTAESIRSQAMDEAEEIRLEAKKKGKEEGLLEKEEELLNKEAQIDAILNEKLEELEEAYNQKHATMEREIVDAISQVLEKVFLVNFQDKKEILLSLINKTLMNIEIGKNFRIRLSEADRSFVEENVDEIRNQLGKDVSFEIVQDSSLEEGDCFVETDFGVFECGVDTQLKNLIKELKTINV